jgi:hypothetical protein
MSLPFASRRGRRRCARRIGSALALLALLTCFACQSADPGWSAGETSARSTDMARSSSEEEVLGFASASHGLVALSDDDGDGLPDRRRSEASDAQEIERRLVYTGTLTLAVPDPGAARAQLSELAHRLGGYVQSERDAAIVLRIPSPRFREGLEDAAKLGREVSRRLDVQDVTEQYIDLELRLKNARALRDRLEALLQKADDVKSALEVERELTRVRLEIEQLEAQLRSLGQRASFGTLAVELRQMAQAPRSAAALPFSWLGSLGVENLLGRGGAR